MDGLHPVQQDHKYISTYNSTIRRLHIDLIASGIRSGSCCLCSKPDIMAAVYPRECKNMRALSVMGHASASQGRRERGGTLRGGYDAP